MAKVHDIRKAFFEEGHSSFENTFDGGDFKTHVSIVNNNVIDRYACRILFRDLHRGIECVVRILGDRENNSQLGPGEPQNPLPDAFNLSSGEGMGRLEQD